MQIVKPYARMVNFNDCSGQDMLKRIEWCGRISHRSEDAQGDETWGRFIQAVVIGHGDWSIVEHISMSADFLVDRGITHEIVRHRLAGYTQESTRFVNYQKKMPPSFIYPQIGIDCQQCLSGSNDTFAHAGRYVHEPPEDGQDYINCPYEDNWLNSIGMAEHSYQRLLAKGWTPQEARSVFPNALASRIIMTCNLRNWRHFFIMRSTREAHPQMREVVIPLLKEFQLKIPILYDDIIPNSRQVDNLKLPR